MLWKNGCSSGSHHTKPLPYQNGRFPKNFCFVAKWSGRHSSTSPNQPRWPLPSLCGWKWIKEYISLQNGQYPPPPPPPVVLSWDASPRLLCRQVYRQTGSAVYSRQSKERRLNLRRRGGGWGAVRSVRIYILWCKHTQVLLADCTFIVSGRP